MDLRRKKLILILSGLVIIFALILVVVLPLASEIKQLSNNIYDQRIILEATKKRAQNISVLISDYDQVKNYHDKISAFFINKEDQLDFLTTLENNAGENSLVQELTLDEIGKIERIKEVPLNISLSGNYLDILKYLAGLENLDYFLSIESINFSKSGSSDALLNKVTATIKTTTYWQEL